MCRHEKTGRIDLNHEVPLGPFTHAFNENLSNYQSFYDIELLGADRVAGREAVKLAITPRRRRPLGLSPVARRGVRPAPSVPPGRAWQSAGSSFSSARVDIGDAIGDEELRTALEGDIVEHRLSPIEQELAEPSTAKPQFRVAWLPLGFRQVQSRRPNRIVFTDGIATFSVFVERTRPQSHREFGALLGGTAVITRRLKDSSQQVTVVGEVPIDTAQKVAESIEPVIY
ncbi:MAG: MucB/RseB C-terminal domain-containing protein [Gammaproteobacteria bacterium]|nr:MucB/RseB C-terminal domain-containing protein [Gammaproteobacteria bacterium]